MIVESNKILCTKRQYLFWYLVKLEPTLDDDNLLVCCSYKATIRCYEYLTQHNRKIIKINKLDNYYTELTVLISGLLC
jgi:hypothetical protein